MQGKKQGAKGLKNRQAGNKCFYVKYAKILIKNKQRRVKAGKINYYEKKIN